jgi:osmotically inducible lipoprotein OsmB
MLKSLSTLLLAAATSAALLAGPAEARDRYRDRDCGDDVALGTGIGALGGAGLGAAINRGNDTGAAIGGAILGAIIGNQIAKDRCDDDRYDAYYYERGRYNTVYYGRPSRWHNPHTGAYGEFRVIRTYDDYGYWDRDRWVRVNYRDDRRRYRRHHRDFDRVTCRDYVEVYNGPGRRGDWRRTHTVCRFDDDWRYIG